MESIGVSTRRTSLVERRSPRRAGPDACLPSECAFNPDALDSTLHLLGNELHVASIARGSLPAVTHKLLQLLLRLFNSSPESRRNHFFSFTETSTDYSLILDSQLLEFLALDDDCRSRMDIVDSKWRPLVVEVGALGSLAGISKIAASVIGPLADRDVSVFCLSTNQDDYVLVKEDNLECALKSLSRGFKLVCDSERDSDILLVDSLEKSNMEVGADPMTRGVNCLTTSPRPITHPFTCSPNQFGICSVVPKALPSVGSLLLALMLFNKRLPLDDVFFSLSVIDEDISMVVDTRDIERFPEGSLYTSEGCWRRIRIGEGPLGFEECGIVAQVSTPLAAAEISTYYICTYYTDHTLLVNCSDCLRAFQRYHLQLQGGMIPEECVQKSLLLLNDRVQTKVTSKNGLSRLSDSIIDPIVLVSATYS